MKTIELIQSIKKIESLKAVRDKKVSTYAIHLFCTLNMETNAFMYLKYKEN